MSHVTVNSRIPQIIQAARAGADQRVERVARDIADRAKGRAPRATGTLANSIQAEQEPDGWAVHAEWYWRLVEYGTRHSGAHPFVTPAVQGAQTRLGGLIGALYR